MIDKIEFPLNIAEFYAGRSIFITGCTGFLGKVLVEKLLRSCPDLKEIFVLMRPKKGMSIDERVHKMFTLPLYDKLRETNPSAFEKVIPVNGDVAAEGLGLDAVVRQVLMDRVSIIFHVAANVRFDDNLRDAIFVNTRSTRDVCILAGNMKNLVALIHVSSTYAHADKPVVEEIFYPSEVDWKKSIKIAENVDVNLLKTFTAKYIGGVPNTYTFTKKLAEAVINDYSDRLPCVIIRPSIVIPTVEEPVSGWLDNFHGPAGLMIGGGKGVVRTVYADPNIIMDFIPIDVVIKALIIVGCTRGRVSIKKDPSLQVFNCSANKINKISMMQVIGLSLKYNEEIPLDNCIWQPHTTMTKCYVNYYINMLIFHILPALILDEILKIAGHKPLLMRLQRSIYIGNVAVSHFMLHEWEFRNDKIVDITAKLSGSDVAFFYDYHNFQLTSFLRNIMLGAKRYLLREDLGRLEKTKQHRNRMWWIDRICKAFWIVILLWVFLRSGTFAYMCSSVNDLF